jgi:glycosyltransferase involved in cell wall biosynthesis
MAPAVSVIVPTYDRWPMVREAVDSVLEQSYSDFELIVVDDGSRDGTAEKLAGHAPGLRLLQQSRAGVAAARNLGVRSATAKYLAFLDSDDLWAPQKLQKQVGFMAANPAVQICQTEEIWLRRGVRVNPRARHRKPSGDIFRRSLELCLVSPSAVMMTRDLFDRVGGFDEAFTVCEDYDLWLRTALVTELPLIPEPLVVKRGGHPDQLSRSIWGLDRFRVLALAKLLGGGIQGERRGWVAEALRQKASILTHGARRRGRIAEALAYERLVDAFAADSHGCEDECREDALRDFKSHISGGQVQV